MYLSGKGKTPPSCSKSRMLQGPVPCHMSIVRGNDYVATRELDVQQNENNQLFITGGGDWRLHAFRVPVFPWLECGEKESVRRHDHHCSVCWRLAGKLNVILFCRSNN
jgi:hypothetical protein